jgi:hypothetical protein
MCFIYKGALLGLGMAWLDADTLEATILPPTYLDEKKSVYPLILSRLYQLMCRKGAIKVVVQDNSRAGIVMAAAGFHSNSASNDRSDTVAYVRYSDRSMDTIITRYRFKAPKTAKGERQRQRLALMQAPWFKDLALAEFKLWRS